MASCHKLTTLRLYICVFPFKLKSDPQESAINTVAEFDIVSEMLLNVITYMPPTVEILVIHFPYYDFSVKSLWARIQCERLDILLSNLAALDYVKFQFSLKTHVKTDVKPLAVEEELRFLNLKFPRVASHKSLTVDHGPWVCNIHGLCANMLELLSTDVMLFRYTVEI